MDQRDNIQDELREIAPGLKGLPKGNPFRVPDNYFSALPDEVMRKIQAQEVPQPVAQEPAGWWAGLLEQIDMALSVVLRPAYVVPILAVVVLAGAMLLLLDTPRSTSVADAPVITQDDIAAFVAGNIDEFEDELIYEQAMAELNGSLELNIFEETDAAELDEYILDHVDEETMQEVML